MRIRSGLTSLVLNGDFQPLTVVSVKRAIILILAGKAEVIEEDTTHTWDSPSFSIPYPVVIRLIKFVKVPYVSQVGLSRRALMARDGGKCIYCGSSDNLTIDHIVPKSKGGTHSWENVGIACRKCNHKKGQRTLAQMGWNLPRPLKAPSGATWRIIGYRSPDPRWQSWLNQ